jgi:hypothetical protein
MRHLPRSSCEAVTTKMQQRGLLLLVSLAVSACGSGTGDDNPFTACNAPTYRVPDGGIPPGAPEGTAAVFCPDAFHAREGRLASGMNLDGLSGNSILPLTSCTATGGTFVVEGGGSDLMNPTFQGAVQVSIGCGFVGPGEYTGDGTGLRIDLTPSQHNGRFVSNAGSACTFCIEEGSRNGWYNCSDLVPRAGGSARLRVGGQFRCE